VTPRALWAGSSAGTLVDGAATEAFAVAGAKRWHRSARALVLAAADFASLFASGTIAYFAWALPVRHQAPGLYFDLAPLLGLFLAGFWAAGLYPGFGLGPVETLRRQSLVTGFGFLVLTALSFALKLPPRYSRAAFVLAVGAALVTVPVVRALVRAAAGRRCWWREPVAVVGSGEAARGLIAGLADAGPADYRPAALLTLGPAPAPAKALGVPAAGGLEVAPDVARRGVRTALVAGGEGDEAAILDRLQLSFHRVLVVRPYPHLPVEGVQVRNLGTAVGIEYTNNLLRRRNRAVKRAVDVGLGALCLLVAAPAIALLCFAVKLASRGPALFAQERTGLDGRRIRVLKIRTMRADAERRLAEYLAARPELRREWDERMKLHDDPRLIPWLGAFLRRFSLDELPQLWNVVRGTMSLVGPRPFPDYHLARFPPEFLRLRQRVRPGITGLWQVMVRSDGTLDEQRAYDSYYIRNWSLWLDAYLLARTLGVVVGGRGAY
jgi:Undecaprenyl-phosphate galactose phosphotransferase WbaP